MKPIKKEEAEIMLKELLDNTLYKKTDIEYLMKIARESTASIPMKAIRQYYDNMEKKSLTVKDRDIMDTLMYFFGP